MQAIDDEKLMARRLEWDAAQSIEGEPMAFFPQEGGEAVVFTVAAVNERHRAPHMLQFAILLRGPAQPIYAQGTYRFRHVRLGDYGFFITPLGRNEKGVDYEACFSYAS